MTASRMSAAGLLRRHLTSGVGMAALVAVLVAVAVAVVAAAPRALTALGTAELRHELAGQSPLLLDLDGRGRIALSRLPDLPLPELVGETDRVIAELPSTLPRPLRDAVGTPTWLVRTPAERSDAGADSPDASLRLVLDLDWEGRVEFVDGTAPAVWTGDERTAADGDDPPLEVALSAGAAELLGVRPGDRIESSPAPLLVAGVYEPRRPDDPYWVHASDLATGLIDQEGGTVTVRASAFIAPGSLGGLRDAAEAGDLAVWMPIDPERTDYREADELRGQVRELLTTRVVLPGDGALDIRSSLVDTIDRVVARMTATGAMLAFELSGLLLVLLAVLALGVQVVVDRRRPVLQLAAARGAGRLQLRSVAALEGLLIAVPGFAVGATVAQAVPEAPASTDWTLPLAIGLAPPLLFAALVDPAPSPATRADLGLATGGRARRLAELVAVLLAVASVVVLARRGVVAVGTETGIDPLVVAAPALIAATVAIGVLRLVPVPLRALQRLLDRTDASAALVGAARAVRAPALGVVAALALVVGISVVVFATVMAATIPAALTRSALDRLGGDIQVRAQALPDDLVASIHDVDGVAGAVAITVVPRVPFEDGAGDAEVTVVLADAESLAAVRPDLPRLGATGGDPTATPTPILASADRIGRIDRADLAVDGRAATLAGSIPSRSFPGVLRNWVLADARSAVGVALGDVGPQLLLARVEPGADAAAAAAEIERLVTAAQPSPFQGSVSVTDVDTELEAARTSPAVSSLQGALLLAAALTLAMTMVTVVLASAAAGRTRRRLVGILRVLGMSRRQIATILAWELAPVAAIAVVAGTGLGLLLPAVLLRLLDLRTFVGGRLQPGPTVEPLWVLAAIAAFLTATAVAGLVAVLVARRVAPAGALKMGEA